MSKEASRKYQGLISQAKQCEYYAACATNGLSDTSRQFWAKRAQDLRREAAALPDDFVDPEFRMPEWGTYGT